VLFIDEAIRRTCDPSALMPPLLCGDFNAEPMSDEIRFLTAKAVIDGRSTYFQDAGAVMHDHGGVTHEPANDFQARLNVPPTRIDYVFVGSPFLRPDGAGRVLRAELAFQRAANGNVRERPLRTQRRHRLAEPSVDAEPSAPITADRCFGNAHRTPTERHEMSAAWRARSALPRTRLRPERAICAAHEVVPRTALVRRS